MRVALFFANENTARNNVYKKWRILCIFFFFFFSARSSCSSGPRSVLVVWSWGWWCLSTCLHVGHHRTMDTADAAVVTAPFSATPSFPAPVRLLPRLWSG